MEGKTAPEVPPHAPQRGWANRLLGRFHVTGLFWYQFHNWGMTILPSWAIGVVVFLFTTFFFFALIRIRRALGDNLVPVLGRCGFLRRQVRIYRTMWSFAWCLSERYERLSTARRFAVDIDLERWRGLFASGEGVILVTAHVGNFEVGSMLPAFEEGRTVQVVREREVDSDAQRFVERLLRRAGGGRWMTHFEDNDPLHGVELLGALRAGGIVGIQGDRPRRGGATVETRLFERPFTLPAGPAALARAAEVALVPVFVLRSGRRRYRVEIRDPIRVARSDDRRADVARATQRVAAEVEWAIRSVPHQWFCFRNLWPKRG
jgi:phosphatidylinositol dimannoside acyltransferase